MGDPARIETRARCPGRRDAPRSRARASGLADLTAIRDATLHPGRAPRRDFAPLPPNEALRGSLIERDGEQPPPGYHAHHIIPDKEFGESIDWMRERLQDADSSINSADNGVFLAASRKSKNLELTRLHLSYIHAGKQKEYAYTLTDRLEDKHGDEFLEEVRKIAEEMRTGKFRTLEIPYGFKKKWKPGMSARVERGTPLRWIE